MIFSAPQWWNPRAIVLDLNLEPTLLGNKEKKKKKLPHCMFLDQVLCEILYKLLIQEKGRGDAASFID